MIYLTPADRRRFWAKVDARGVCWEWIGARKGRGYGNFYLKQAGVAKWFSAHRVAYQALVGPIADHLVIDHLCRNLVCVNPDHLEPVTPRENSARGYSPPPPRRPHVTHCPQGHEYTPSNTSTWQGRKKCKACDRERHRRKRAASR